MLITLRLSVFTVCVFGLISSTQFVVAGRSKRQYVNFTYLEGGGVDESGVWGPWSESSECSRTCGGGVSHQERNCLSTRSDDSANCVGSSRKYFSCNIQDCPEGSIDFRSEQCSRFNNVTFEGRLYEWVPYNKVPNKCELNCMPKTERFYYRHLKKVVDGTRCDDDTLDVCVDGICLAVGCDMMLGSTAKEDKCRECGGDGSSCQSVEGLFDLDNLQVGYNDLLLIPAGATNIRIQERKGTNNYLAIRNLTGFYFLNGDWRIDFPRDLKIAGTTFHYERKPHGFNAPENLRALGPTIEPIFIVLLYQDTNPGITYEYSIPQGVSNAQPDTYSWIFGSWGDCTASCGGGHQVRTVNCARTSNFDIVSEYLCDPSLKPLHNQTCNIQACPPSWYIGDWEPCSQTCGTGVQYRNVYCQRLLADGMFSLAHASECKKKHGIRPAVYKKCIDGSKCPEWYMGPWSACSKMCGDGEQTRAVFCKSKNQSDSTFMPDASCDLTSKPLYKQICTEGPCEGLEWLVSEWTGCEQCGQTVESHKVVCASQAGKVYMDKFCNGKHKPTNTQFCNDINVCETMWVATEWSECSTECGEGVQSRSVFCAVMEGDVFKKIPDEKCNKNKKYENIKNCTNEICKGLWYTGPWNRCTAPCGGGKRSRLVVCISAEQVLDNSACSLGNRPFESESCNSHACDEDELLVVDGCINSIHGCCPDGISSAGPNFEGCPPINDEADIGCVNSEFGCCYDGYTPALGPFRAGCYRMSSCSESKFGCCQDQITPAQGSNFKGCPEIHNCSATLYGCCPDGITMATGTRLAGCIRNSNIACRDTRFNCCPDGFTPAQGPNFIGCDEGSGADCADSLFGCCPNDITPAKGINSEGCPDSVTLTPVIRLTDITEIPLATEAFHCSQSAYGCCPDGYTFAYGPNNEGCLITIPATVQTPPPTVSQTSCENSLYGCCSDGVTPAEGPKQEGCNDIIIHGEPSCVRMEFGCCPDKATPARGPSYQGCPGSEYDCSFSTYGCCADGRTTASGPGHEGCPIPDIQHSEACDYPKDTGPCRNYTVQWYYDVEYGDCNRFWYGGCGGNDNRFLTQEDCQHRCVTPDGIDSCFLPKAVGPCKESYPRWYFDHDGISCVQFSWGGCLGNNNKFETQEQCEERCITPNTFDVCEQPKQVGPCRGEFQRWYYDKIERKCLFFIYGGCKGNKNQFETEEDCNKRCVDSKEREVCSLPKSEGSCSGLFPRWYYDVADISCQQFTYSGCNGNGNRFTSKEICESICNYTKSEDLGEFDDKNSVDNNTDVCNLPRDNGPCNSQIARWYYEKVTSQCQFFVYGGCQGNGNRFENREICEKMCIKKAPVTSEVCTLPRTVGPCKHSIPRWYFDPTFGSCQFFYYGGCSGNGNNFDTLDGCEKMCGSSPVIDQEPQDACSLPKDEGPCYAHLPRWWHDSSDGICKEFIYGGCVGNTNRFLSEIECLTNCSKEQDACSLPYDEGPCNSNLPRFWHDSSDGTCKEFIYGGCHGNLNRFLSEMECLHNCSKVEDICQLPLVVGPCNDQVIQWHHDPEEQMCKLFYYSGCQGNANRFETKESCEKECGLHLPNNILPTKPSHQVDKQVPNFCHLPSVRGPCRGTNLEWYYEPLDDECLQFLYGGCEGNQNRFTTKEECEKTCNKAKVPLSAESCALPSESGPCYGNFPKWHYDSHEATCKLFIYGGCQGNDNRFETFTECEEACNKRVRQPNSTISSDLCNFPMDPGPCNLKIPRWYFDHNEKNCLLFFYGGCGGNPNHFYSYHDCVSSCYFATFTCPHVECNEQCPYGFETDANGCTTCSCFHPCKDHNCPQEMQCAVQVVQCFSLPCPPPRPICRAINKPGECPVPANRIGTCIRECENDANCAGTRKCCFNGCGTSCADAVFTELESGIQPEISKPKPSQSPYIAMGEVNIKTKVGESVTLRCSVRGHPPPTIIWQKGSKEVADQDGRFHQLVDGSLQISPVAEDDTATYTCTAYNGVGQPAVRSVQLFVEVPVRITGGLDVVKSRIGQQARLECNAYGIPVPNVVWTKDHEAIIFDNIRYQLFGDHSLLINDVDINDEGIYTCTASNDPVSEVSKKVTLTLDEKVTVEIASEATTLSASSNMTLGCLTNGRPKPSIEWFKDDVPIEINNRIEIYENGTLLICRVRGSDAGRYICKASNEFESAQATIQITIKGILLRKDCTDYPFFANCALIVRAQLCNNLYYSRFCCKSCTEAGQLPTGEDEE